MALTPSTKLSRSSGPRKIALFLASTLVLTLLAGCATPARTSTPTSASTGTPAPQTPAAPTPAAGFSDREPSRLEAKILIDTGDLHFVDAQGAQDGPFRVPSGKVVGIHVRNTDELGHEIIFGREVATKDGVLDGYNESLFDQVEADIFTYGPNKMEVGGVTGFGEIELDSGADVWIRVTFPADLKGTWEIGCFVPDHYESGMRAMFIIE